MSQIIYVNFRDGSITEAYQVADTLEELSNAYEEYAAPRLLPTFPATEEEPPYDH